MRRTAWVLASITAAVVALGTGMCGEPYDDEEWLYGRWEEARAIATQWMADNRAEVINTTAVLASAEVMAETPADEDGPVLAYTLRASLAKAVEAKVPQVWDTSFEVELVRDDFQGAPYYSVTFNVYGDFPMDDGPVEVVALRGRYIVIVNVETGEATGVAQPTKAYFRMR